MNIYQKKYLPNPHHSPLLPRKQQLDLLVAAKATTRFRSPSASSVMPWGNYPTAVAKGSEAGPLLAARALPYKSVPE